MDTEVPARIAALGIVYPDATGAAINAFLAVIDRALLDDEPEPPMQELIDEAGRLGFPPDRAATTARDHLTAVEYQVGGTIGAKAAAIAVALR